MGLLIVSNLPLQLRVNIDICVLILKIKGKHADACKR